LTTKVAIIGAKFKIILYQVPAAGGLKRPLSARGPLLKGAVLSGKEPPLGAYLIRLFDFI